MGKSFKSRFAKQLSRLRNLLCCRTIKVKVEPVNQWMMPPRIVESPDEGPVAPALFRSPASVSAEDVAAIRDIAGINIATACCVIKSKTREINDYSDQPEDTPVPFLVRSAETNAIQGIVVRGSFAQDNLGPMFNNAQCTTMAYQSLAYRMVLGQPDTWNYRDIDAILHQGHLLHSHFRYVMKLSTNEDNRIAIHELPVSYEVRVLPPSSTNGSASNALAQKVLVTFIYGVDGIYSYETEEMANSCSGFAPEFPVFILQTFASGHNEEVNMILTIGDYSMAIWRRKEEDTIWLFDSHRRAPTGLRHDVPTWESDSFDTGAALARSFTGFAGLVNHITEIYGENFIYNARFFNLNMGDSNSVPVAGNDADGVIDDSGISLEDGVPAAENNADGVMDGYSLIDCLRGTFSDDGGLPP